MIQCTGANIETVHLRECYTSRMDSRSILEVCIVFPSMAHHSNVCIPAVIDLLQLHDMYKALHVDMEPFKGDLGLMFSVWR